MTLSVPPSSAIAESFARYPASARRWDELKDAEGKIRPHWNPFLEQIAQLGLPGMKERRDTATRLLREHGVTYNVYSEGRSAERPWNLDLLPLVISSAEWEELEKGLLQRTRLVNLLLGDIYGEQRILRDGLAPPGLIQANPCFLRQCHGVKPAGGRYLTLHAVDLARAADGCWWVLADRTQCPSGVGYTLENRIIVSKILADEMRDLRVHRLASFFKARKSGLRAMAPWTETPTIVLLTPGPYTETYFEHAYIARYLGYPLVEGSDLTVRNRRVYIKTIEGLHPVDVIIRRVDDTFCDPLELRSDSFLGVPGLLEAARAGNVAISNALGSGAIEGPAWLAFLPALSRRLLGEELLIPNVATWWCGQTRERAFALENLSKLVVKAAFPGGSEPIFCHTLDKQGLQALAAKITMRPCDFVAQQPVPLSTAPIWKDDHAEPRPLILRCFIISDGENYSVMPGGLTRVSVSADSPVVSSRYGGSSKDTWILSSRPVDEVTLLDRRGMPVDLHRSAAIVPSRMLDNLFWLGRYTERLEDTVRLLRVVLSRVTGEGTEEEARELDVVLKSLVVMGRVPQRLSRRYSMRELTATFKKLVYDRDRTGSVGELLRRVGVLTARLRVRFSGDTWRILHQMQTEFPAEPASPSAVGMLEVLHRLVFQLAALSGVETENMTRGAPWRFLDLGRRIERANNVIHVIQTLLSIDPAVSHSLPPLLEYCDSTMTYRRRYFAAPELAPALDLLLSDRTNPRAFAFQWASIGDHLNQLGGLSERQPEQQKFAEITASLVSGELKLAAAEALNGNWEPIEKLLTSLGDGCWALSDALSTRYFTHVLPRAN